MKYILTVIILGLLFYTVSKAVKASSATGKTLKEKTKMKIKVTSNEKIFYPPQKLKTSETPEANAKKGTLAYYAPWGNVVMFYQNFGSAPGLYELGQAVSGSENIQKMSDNIQVAKEKESKI